MFKRILAKFVLLCVWFATIFGTALYLNWLFSLPLVTTIAIVGVILMFPILKPWIPHPNWTIFVIGAILEIVGIICMFTPVNQRMDFGYGVYVDVPTYPYFNVGIILDTIGLLAIIASFFYNKE